MQDNRKALIRVVLESLVQFPSPAAMLARLYQFTHPTDFEVQFDKWREDLSNLVNSLDVRLAYIEKHVVPHLAINQLSFDLAMWLAKTSLDAIPTYIAFNNISAINLWQKANPKPTCDYELSC